MIKTVVIGMGIMGPDIALSLALGGCEVTALDSKQESIDKAKDRHATTLVELINHEVISSKEAASIPDCITFSMDWEAVMPQADFVFEAVPENLEIKKGIFKRCDNLCRENTIIASNTSCISMTEIASEMQFPNRAIITHWFIPAFLMPVVEIVPGKNTSETTVTTIKNLLTKVGKKSVICKEHPGFVHNYIQAAMCKAAITLVEQGICSAEDVDTIIENGFALRLPKIGPMKMADYAGLDTCLSLNQYIYAKTGNEAFSISPMIEEKVARGELGLKTGKGLYTYTKDEVFKMQKLAEETIIKIKKALK
jgi:3-hydroxybutyryl-CoA dehydrogenase